MTEMPTIRPESRLLIDGKLVEARDGATFDVINPANQEVVGSVADASPTDMAAAIDAARRAFDETSWSTDREFRKRCLLQLQDALDAEVEELREQLIQEAGAPRMLTGSAQLDTPLSDAIRYPVKLIDEFAWEVDLGDAINKLAQALATGNTVVPKIDTPIPSIRTDPLRLDRPRHHYETPRPGGDLPW